VGGRWHIADVAAALYVEHDVGECSRHRDGSRTLTPYYALPSLSILIVRMSHQGTLDRLGLFFSCPSRRELSQQLSAEGGNCRSSCPRNEIVVSTCQLGSILSSTLLVHHLEILLSVIWLVIVPQMPRRRRRNIALRIAPGTVFSGACQTHELLWPSVGVAFSFIPSNKATFC